MTEREPRERLYWLIDEYQQGRIETGVFCAEFEKTYNLELKKDSLLKGEQRAFKALFDKVVYYSPFSEERARIVNYLGEDDIRAAVAAAVADLRQGPMASN